ncbi:AbiA family abortive infection protein [Enterococcus sp.]|uniref:AbiA family abortive infection protein n=1 Tax=Enterococcus sp. TaxID=35783 RepID=UPI00289BDB10|nr:AbiA family abortive infection protein [Enterococcus sp.]
MLQLTHENWVKSIEMVRAISSKVQKMYLQMYPFSLIDEEWENITSEIFFEEFIKTGKFLEFDSTYFNPVRYTQKGDGSLRRTILVSPLSYLILLATGCEIERQYRYKQKVKNTHASIYCSSSFGLDPTELYKKSYDEYRTSLQYGHDQFSYYFKIDITNYYDSIDVNRLFKLIEDEKILDARSSLLLSTFIKTIGNGNFPTIDSHGGLSYLATNVYLDNLDAATQIWIESRKECEGYYLVRYVDDLYIFFNSDTDELAELFATDLLDYVRDLYIGFNLRLNESKQVRIKKTSELLEEITISFYDFFVNGENIDYELYYSIEDLVEFFNRIESMPQHASSDDFDKALDAFKKIDIEMSRSDILNGFIYSNKRAFENEAIVTQLSSILSKNIRFLKLSVKQLVVSVLNTGNGCLVKKMLNQVFKNYRNSNQNKYDELIIIEYLIQRGFKHDDLIAKITESSPELSKYITTFCVRKSLIELITEEKKAKSLYNSKGDATVYGEDSILHFMMLMFIYNRQQGNLMIAHSFLKSYFDRYVAIVALILGESGKRNGKPDYKKYYKDAEHKKLLNICDLSENVATIDALSKLRNTNPVNHSSAEMLNQEQIYMADYQQNISDVIQLMKEYKNFLSSKIGVFQDRNSL